jgi:phage shock protein PspC (stress-responsive transcriptional regulator)
MTEITEPALEEAPPRRLVRTEEGRHLAGVASGLGQYFDVNPLVYRIAFAALTLAGGTGLLLYLAAWLVIPHERSDDSIATRALRDNRERPWLVIGAAVLALGAVLALSEARFWPGPGNVWLAATLLGAALLWWHVGGREGRAASRKGVRAARRPSLFAPVLGALIAAFGVVGLVDVLDLTDVDWAVMLAIGAVLVGVAVAAGAATGRRVIGAAFLGLVLLAAFAGAAASPVDVSAGVGDRVEHVGVGDAVEPMYELGVGSLVVDLGDATLPPGRTEVEASVGVGELVVYVPKGAALEVDAYASLGRVEVLGRVDDGPFADERVVRPGTRANAPTLVLDADAGVGNVEIRRW